MGFDCWREERHNNTILGWYILESDSLVNDQVLREIRSNSERDASLPSTKQSNLSIFSLSILN